MGITDGKLLYCHGVAEGGKDKKFSTLEYNNRTVYYCFNNPFTYDCGIPDMHLPPITIDDRPPRIREPVMPQICSQIPFLLPLKTLLVTLPPLLILQVSFLMVVIKLSMFWRKVCLWTVLSTDDTAVGNIVKFDATKRQGSVAPHAQVKKRNFITVRVFPVLVKRQGLVSWNINILYH